MRPCLYFFAFLLSGISLYGQAGKDGPRTVSVTNTIVNEYTELGTNMAAGSPSINVLNSNLNGSGIFSAPLAAGDLIMIIQMQGATISTADDPSYGTITAYNNAGKWEFAEVSGVPSSTVINLSCPLQNDYTTSGKVQVIRVPRFSSLTVNGGGQLTCPAWNGATGGVVAVEVSGATIINAGGFIDANTKGFRGGVVTDNNSGYGVLNFVWPANDYGAEKGESIAGSQFDYDLFYGGRYCKGAPANGGGGANGHNSGGGGGANAGSPAGYTGNGNPDISNAGWVPAWNLESPGFSGSTSTGGGKGGYTFSSANQNATTIGPFNPAWGGDQRRNNGGLGGRPLDYGTGRLFMGGGGGSGDQNDSEGGIGGNGGGIVYLMTYGTISGGGQINSNGQNGANSISNNSNDGAGGGGGGGTIILNAGAAITGISANANGGNGGNQNLQIFATDAYGPGGGGGGGFIGVTNGSITRAANGGNNGTTNSQSLSEFPPNGATRGGMGQPWELINDFRLLSNTVNICSGTTATLNVNLQGTPPAGTIYSWFDVPVGGASIGTGSSFTTPVLTSGATYYVTTCPGTARVPITVNVDQVSVSFNATGACAGTPSIFSANASSSAGTTISGWLWDFGNSSGTSTSQNPTYAYPTGGTYTVTVTATAQNGCTASSSQQVNIPVSANAAFSPSITSGCGSLNVTFTNGSTGAGQYTWNFGDGSPTSTSTNPSHSYAAPGTYTVSLIAGTGACADTLISNNLITVRPQPVASFSANNTICLGDTVFFSNASQPNGATISGYNWNFGDGSPASTLQNPFHVYSSAGNYTVTLTAQNPFCPDDTTLTVFVNPAPVAGFTSNVTSGCTPLTVNFQNQTTGSPAYTWNFGDGTPASSATNPSHTYANPGTYNVTLIASQGSCADTIVIGNMIQVTNGPTASFNAASTALCLGDTVSFINASTGNGSSIVSYSWNFDDGSPLSSQQNPSHVYASAGTYDVRLTVSTGACTDDTIIQVNVNPAPVAGFSSATTNGCAPLSVMFQNTTTGSPTYAWDFGDGSGSSASTPSHTYTTPGVYPVTLIATQGSCADTLTIASMITVGAVPQGAFNASDICVGDSLHVQNTTIPGGANITSYTWNFGDGTPSVTGSAPSHLFQNSGTFDVTLIVNESAGCNDTVVQQVEVNPLPAVNFSSSVNSGCDSLTVQFTNLTTGASTYSWLFGDGGTSTDENPLHTYTTPGQYTVVVTGVSADGCQRSRAFTNLITVYDAPDADFAASQTSLCKGDCISFTNLSSPGVNSWQWTFNGAQPSSATGSSPGSVCYPFTGNYDVTLSVSNGQCTSSTTKPAHINVADCSQAPVASFISGDTSICAGSCVDFVSLSSNATSWQWNFPGGQPSGSTQENPAGICYSQPGSHPVTLIVSNPSGVDTLSVPALIAVATPPQVPSFTQNGNVLTSSPAAAYQWFYNNVPISGATSQVYTATLSGDYSVMITDANGCTAMSTPKLITVVGIEDVEQVVFFHLFPNPVRDELSLLVAVRTPGKFTLTVHDAIGRLVMQKDLNLSSTGETHRISTEKLTAGVYVLSLASGDTRVYRRFVRE